MRTWIENNSDYQMFNGFRGNIEFTQKELSFCNKLKFLIPIPFQADGLNFKYFKFRTGDMI